ncbi:MAG: efflux RND transporter permease subunit [Myxococcota bacterium]
MTGHQSIRDPEHDRDEAEAGEERGPLAWWAKNNVAANVLMVVLIGGGLVMMLAGQIRQEVFPEVDLDMVLVQVPYPGASPEEVEQGVVLSIEEAVRGLDGVKEVRSTATEGTAVVAVELLLGTDPDRALSDVKSAVDRITSFPEDSERPVVSLATTRRQVISLVFYGDVGEKSLRSIAERARDDLLQSEAVTQMELSGVRPLEIAIEVPQAELRKHGLTLDGIAQAVRAASVDLPAGELRTQGGDVLLRTKERRDLGQEYERIVLRSQPDGTEVRIGDVADVKDGFQEVDREAFFNRRRAVMLNVYRVGDETPIEVAEAVKEHARDMRADLPPGVGVATWSDRSEIYRDRIDLLLRNAYLGLALVLLTLGLFLEMRLAFWVTLGIPISFLGGLLFMPAMDVSLNMISLFAFIVTLGIVVDDAIVVGEAVYKHRRDGMPFIKAAIAGVREVAVPVVFAVITTCIAFAPMLFVPGVMGKFFRVIPIVVILVLLMSLVECLLILPAHLAHTRQAKETGIRGWVHHQQQRFSRAVERFVGNVYAPFLRRCLRWRYLTMAVAVAVLLATLGLWVGGRMKFTFMPKIDHDLITATLEMPVGTPADVTRGMQRRMTRAAQQVVEDAGGDRDISRGIFSELGAALDPEGGPQAGDTSSGSHYATVMVYLVQSDQRDISGREFAERWREEVGDLPGAESLQFDYSIGGTGGAAIDLELSHPNEETLEQAASELARTLGNYAGVIDVDDGFALGKQQLDLTLTQQGRALGLTELELARQVRGSFFGSEALRQQRGRDEVRVYVRLPEADRESLHTVEQMVLQTPEGAEIPLDQAAHVERGRAYTEIKRTDARRTINVTADVIPRVANANEVVASLQETALPELMQKYPGLSYSLGGQQEEQQEAMSSLFTGTALALLAMFALLAVAFKSYIQPLIIMVAIPFGLVGALLGHLLMGYDLSLMSMMGVVALAGVVVNDSLIMVVATNEYRGKGMDLLEGVIAGGTRRFRPILLTSLTTFFGLLPMITETSVQAKFLIPMAISLGFGVIFATGITLVLVPTAYVIIDDARRGAGRAWRFLRGKRPAEPSPAQ